MGSKPAIPERALTLFRGATALFLPEGQQRTELIFGSDGTIVTFRYRPAPDASSTNVGLVLSFQERYEPGPPPVIFCTLEAKRFLGGVFSLAITCYLKQVSLNGSLEPFVTRVLLTVPRNALVVSEWRLSGVNPGQDIELLNNNIDGRMNEFSIVLFSNGLRFAGPVAIYTFRVVGSGLTAGNDLSVTLEPVDVILCAPGSVSA